MIELNWQRSEDLPNHLRSGSICRLRGFPPRADLSLVAQVVGPASAPMAMSATVDLGLVSRLESDGRSNYGYNWHHDQSFIERPPDWTALRLVQVAATTAARTVFADCSRLLDFLSEDFESVLRGLRVLHSSHHMHGPTGEAKLECSHPLIIDLENGDPALFASPAASTSVAGWTTSESRALFELLFPMMNWPELVTDFSWVTADVIVWPNRRFVHRSLSSERPGRRALERVVGHYVRE